MIEKPEDRAEFEADIRQRQPNIVFPDTVQNQGRFYRNLATQNLRPVHLIGVGVLAIMAISPMVAMIYTISNDFAQDERSMGEAVWAIFCSSLLPGLVLFVLFTIIARHFARKH